MSSPEGGMIEVKKIYIIYARVRVKLKRTLVVLGWIWMQRSFGVKERAPLQSLRDSFPPGDAFDGDAFDGDGFFGDGFRAQFGYR